MVTKRHSVTLLACIGLYTQTGLAELLIPGATLMVQTPSELRECVVEGQLGAAILAQLTARSTTTQTTLLRNIEVTVSRESSGIIAILRLSGTSSGLRRLEATHCQGLSEALAVTIAIILDGDAQAHAQAPANEAISPQILEKTQHQTVELPVEKSALNTPFRRQPVAVPFTPPVAASSGIRIHANTELRAWVGGGVGTWSDFNIESGLALYLDNWGLELGAFYQPTKAHRLGQGKVQILTLGGLVAGCFHDGSRWHALFCLRTMIGGERVHGEGFATEESPQVLPTVSLGPSIGVETGSRFIVGLNLIGQVSFPRDSYNVQNTADPLKMPVVIAWLVARMALSSGQAGQ